MSPLREHGLVDLLVPGEERRSARVSAIGHGHLLLTLFGPPVGPEVGPETTIAALELLGDRGVTRVEGRVGLGGDPRALTFEPSDPALLPQRRLAPRRALDAEVMIEREGGAAATGRVVDVSETGIRVRSPEPLAAGQVVHVTFRAGDESLAATGRVVRSAEGGEHGVAFDAPLGRLGTVLPASPEQVADL